MIRSLVACAFLMSSVSIANADTVAYVDEIVVAGGPDPAQARTFVTLVIEHAGMRPIFVSEGGTPCGDAPSCLASRARARNAQVGLRLTVADVGGRIVVAMLASNGRDTRREIAEEVALDQPADTLAMSLRELAPPPRRSRVAAWVVAGTSVGLALGGLAAGWHARDLRDEFFAEHVASNGDVYGISPEGARAEERRAQRWSIIGGLAFGAAIFSGTAATILFVRSTGGEARPAGFAVAMELP